MLGVFLQQLVQDGCASGPYCVKEILLLSAQRGRPLTAGAQRRIEGEVAEQIEGIGLGLLRRSASSQS